MKLIDADALKATMIETLEQIKANPKMDGQEMHIIAGIAMLGEMIDDSPTINAVPVVKGEWIEYTRVVVPEPYNKWEQAWKCDKCGFDDGFPAYNFCPHCGADMREEIDHD